MDFNPKDGGLSAKPKLGFKVPDPGPPIFVWWDYENCEVLNSADFISIANNIVAGLTKLRVSGPITLFVYVDVGRIPRDVSEALQRTGITMIHVLPGRNSADMKMVLGMCLWAVEHPPPATYVLNIERQIFLNLFAKIAEFGVRYSAGSLPNQLLIQSCLCSTPFLALDGHFSGANVRSQRRSADIRC
ncbi:uncharacterized protein [Primulina huaijiensis]|uniref:uncharacterized protein n=1 Tax=Primulina huaijiensis TaxID=1492673 RepID=UPI003CC76505